MKARMFYTLALVLQITVLYIGAAATKPMEIWDKWAYFRYGKIGYRSYFWSKYDIFTNTGTTHF
jgi:hypothetical protein